MSSGEINFAVHYMNKGIHSRGYLPHWDFAGSVQGVTFRLADAVPAKVIQSWRQELSSESDAGAKKLRQRIAKYEDTGHGSCLLADPECAGIVQQSLISGHGKTYKLLEWCVMPNHVHVLIRLLDSISLGIIVKGWKGGTALQINRLLERRGSFWMRDYHDRSIRDLEHYDNSVAYIRNNPVKAGMCERAGEWKFSSAGCGWDANDEGCAITERAK